jgi:hypothetical protein
MQTLTEIALEKATGGVFTRPETVTWIRGSSGRQWSLLKRAVAAGEIVRIRRGLYCLADKYLPRKVDPLVLAQRIYGPSYISLEAALSRHGWIPEAVYAVTSVCQDRSRRFDTPVGLFHFARVPQAVLYAGVERVAAAGGESFMLASPLKALADYVYVQKCDWDSSRPVVESLRVEEDSLADLAADAFEQIADNYTSRRVRRFLAGLRKDLNL